MTPPLWWRLLAAIAVPRRALTIRRTIYDASRATGIGEDYIATLCRARIGNLTRARA